MQDTINKSRRVHIHRFGARISPLIISLASVIMCGDMSSKLIENALGVIVNVLKAIENRSDESMLEDVAQSEKL